MVGGVFNSDANFKFTDRVGLTAYRETSVVDITDKVIHDLSCMVPDGATFYLSRPLAYISVRSQPARCQSDPKGNR